VFNTRKVSHWIVLTGIVIVAIGGLAWGVKRLSTRTPISVTKAPDHEQGLEQEPHDTKIEVKVIHPKKGLLERLSTQPGSIQAYESVKLYAKVPGFLKKQTVDIGHRVKRGQVLAIVDVPELESQLKRNSAAVRQAQSRIVQMKARVASARADLLAAKASVTRAEAADKSAAAWVRYRLLQQRRMEALFASRSIEEKLVDEAKEHYETAVETELSAKETITANKAKVSACEAKIDQALADVTEAEAEVEVAEAELEKVQVQVAFATITAPFDGVITTRSLNPGDYVRSANEGGANVPLLTVDRTDLMRVVVQVPDRDVPFTDPGNDAFVLIDALPGRKLPAKVSRIASFEDPQTRLMRVEIDLPNPTGKIRHGMYGQVTIILDQDKDHFSIPSTCVTSKQEDGKATIYVVRDGHAHQVSVRLGVDNGLRVSVLDGLTADDEVILNPGNTLSDGVEVTPTVVN
jgi:HlyD family secretion protein